MEQYLKGSQNTSYKISSTHADCGGFNSPLLWCVNHQDADYVLREIHKAYVGTMQGANL